jgi:hypothetical protein
LLPLKNVVAGAAPPAARIKRQLKRPSVLNASAGVKAFN